MKTLKEYYGLIDKSSWPRGEWDNEPDILNLFDEKTELYCRIHRMSFQGTLNGYVALPKGHKYYGLQYDEIPVRAYGGLTWDCFPEPELEDTYYPSVPYEDTPGLVFWIGFDTTHAYDLWPGLSGILASVVPKHGSYKNVEFVKKELSSLCKQLMK